MESIKVSGTRLINARRGERGVLFQGRFFDRALRTAKEYHEKVGYIHRPASRRSVRPSRAKNTLIGDHLSGNSHFP
ncbi:MAG TPA: hypothetical protein VG204_18485 [Terriglobia bacterium]|nr:hypothetical protein [Terriglobia bacterium]